MSTAQKVINALRSRRGFDGWWDDIDGDVQEDIITKISDTIAADNNRLSAENAQLRQWLRGELSISDDDIDEALDKDDHP